LAAALGLWRTERSDGTPLLGATPGVWGACGGSRCFHAAWHNPFREGLFEPGWTRASHGLRWRPVLVTMLHGRSFEDAARLVESAVEAERLGGAAGEFLLWVPLWNATVVFWWFVLDPQTRSAHEPANIFFAVACGLELAIPSAAILFSASARRRLLEPTREHLFDPLAFVLTLLVGASFLLSGLYGWAVPAG